MSPVGGDTPIVPVLGNDTNELEIVQFGAALSPYMLSDAEKLAIRLDPGGAGAIRQTLWELRPRLARYNRRE
jgi:hypothetical protein